MIISLEKARSITYTHIPATGTVVIPLSECLGRITAEDIYAPMDQPPFRRSCMDGYALCACDAVPGTYPVICEIDAGCTESYDLIPGQAVRIMTGARLPENASIVIPQEMTDYNETIVTIHSIPSRSNIAPIGEDFHKGELLIRKGTLLGSGAVASLAAAGITSVSVKKKLRTAVISTGDELIPIGSPLKPGQIYDANLVYVTSRLKELGCEVTKACHAGDSVEMIKKVIAEARLVSDYIITTGGVSVGNKDLLEQSVLEMGAEVLFHGISIKPGMPTMFSLLNGTPILSLSGNPFSAGSMLEYLFPIENVLYTNAVLEEAYTGKRMQTRIVRGFWNGDTIRLFTNQKNGTTRDSAMANCLAELPPGTEELPAGSLIRIKLL